MPSRNIPPPPSNFDLLAPAPASIQFPVANNHHHPPTTRLLPPLAAATAAFSLFLAFAVCFRKITRKRTAPSDSKPPYRFSYSVLRRATSSFSPSQRLGQGGSGSVFRGNLPASSYSERKIVAVKVMDSGSLQGEREFQNELFFASKLDSPLVVSVIGFSYDRKRRRMLLVYDIMDGGNLQDALLHRKCPELMEWNRRFSMAVDIAKGMDYLHSLETPVIHGDIKPSNILLDQSFSAKLADFGLARLKSEDQSQVEVVVSTERDEGRSEVVNGISADDCGSAIDEVESVTIATDCEDLSADQSPTNIAQLVTASPRTGDNVITSPETTVVSLSPEFEKNSLLYENSENVSTDGEKRETSVSKNRSKVLKSLSKKDWWWKQETNVAEKGKAKDYGMDWIPACSNDVGSKKSKEKKKDKRLEWWMSLEEEEEQKSKKKQPVRQWWKEEYCEELAKKNKLKKKQEAGTYRWPREEDSYTLKRKKKKKRGNSRGSIDWWADGLSGELWKTGGTSHDSLSGEIGKSCGISSTPSMRGTVFYMAPEYGGGGELSEKSDVYSYGVLLLVLLAGRRPLEVTRSASEIQQANLMSWARHLARKGKLLDLIDKKIVSLDQEQALLCSTVAMLCLQRSPLSRPSMKEVVGMLTGQLDPPNLPMEFSPSPPLRLPRRKAK